MLLRLAFGFTMIFALVAISSGPNSAWAESSARREVNLELEEVEGASSYELELESERTGKVLNFRMREPIWKASVRPGDYKLKLRSYDSRGVPGEWSEPIPFTVKLPSAELVSPKEGERILTKEEDEYELRLEWENVPDTKEYRVTLEDSAGKKYKETFKTNKGQVTLPVAREYKWSVIPVAKNGDEGESSGKLGTFSLIGAPIEKPEIEPPQDKYVYYVKWSKPEYSESFSYLMYIQNKSKGWDKVDQKQDFQNNEVDIPAKFPGGRYRFALRAENPLRENSPVATIEFDVYDGDRSPAAIDEMKLRDTLEKPTPWYFIASYLISNMNYSGINNQAKTPPTYNAIGGTGRLGVGYISPKNKKGFYGIIDLSGMDLDGTNVTWAAVELHRVWRYNWGRNIIRPSAGLFYKELIESLNTFDNVDYFEHVKLSYIGPHVGLDFWRPLSYKWGIQLNTRLYYGLSGSTPNGRDYVPTASYQIGVMGSYRLSHNVMGFLGWAHRRDQAVYESTPRSSLFPGPGESVAEPGDLQEINIQGDFLNLLLEWGF